MSIGGTGEIQPPMGLADKVVVLVVAGLCAVIFLVCLVGL